MKTINIKTITTSLKKIDSQKLYSPNQIVEFGVIVNTLQQASIFTIYRLIKNKKLPAMDVSTGDKAQYLINGADIKKYVKKAYGIK